jgi:hypothetical protein
LKFRRPTPDAAAVLLLVALWLLFFWRLFTPVYADQASLREGDFSGQFVTFGAYQYQRFSAGEVPLWNPYNNGGLPFIADTQAAVFYPPRLLTIALSDLSGGWRYNSLQLEMTAHVLLYTLLVYALLRRMTLGRPGSVIGSIAAAVVAGYGGFMTGYPPLQLALLESAAWLPLTLLGVLEATRTDDGLRWPWLALSGLGLGLAWMAGHPQTAWFSTYLFVAYLGYRVYVQRPRTVRYRWTAFVGGVALVGLITVGVTAVQLLPGFEYLARSMRVDFSFDAKGNGFPFQDVLQMLFPGVVSLYSPLYVGVSGLALAGIAAAGRDHDSPFWAGAALVGLLLSFGANAALFHALYNLLPGLSFFRGQERAAFVVANALAILAGLGVVILLERGSAFRRGVQRALIVLLVICGGTALLVFALWLGDREAYGMAVGPVVFSALIAALALLLLPRLDRDPRWRLLLIALVVFELFSINIDNVNYEPIPAEERAIMQVPPLVTAIHRATADSPAPVRVDGNFIGLWGNSGSMYTVPDIRGISPLFLDGPHAIIQRELPSEVAWELFAVGYVLTSAEGLPVESELVATDPDYRGQTIHLHALADSRPFAHLLSDYVVVEDDRAARALLADPTFDERRTAILHQPPPVEQFAPVEGEARVTAYAPESFTVEVQTANPALLSLAHVDYPGWEATLDGEPIGLTRAYGGLTALTVPSGEHTVRLTYNPLTYRVGTVLSLVTWAGLGILGVVLLARRTRTV